MKTDFFSQLWPPSQISEVLRSQIEMSPWELFPSLITLLFLGAGFAHFSIQNRKKRTFSYAQRGTRRKLALPLVISTPVTREFSVRTFDVSLTGAFLAYEDLKSSMTFTSLLGKRTGIKVGDLVDIKVYTGRFSQFSCQAKVVRYNFSDNSLSPKGIGIEFVNVSKKNRKVLEDLLFSDDYAESA